MEDNLLEIPKPIGSFIIENSTGVQGNDGVYYHYAEVCKLLKLYEKQIRDEKETGSI